MRYSALILVLSVMFIGCHDWFDQLCDGDPTCHMDGDDPADPPQDQDPDLRIDVSAATPAGRDVLRDEQNVHGLTIEMEAINLADLEVERMFIMVWGQQVENLRAITFDEVEEQEIVLGISDGDFGLGYDVPIWYFLDAGDEVDVKFRFNIPEDAEPGTDIQLCVVEATWTDTLTGLEPTSPYDDKCSATFTVVAP